MKAVCRKTLWTVRQTSKPELRLGGLCLESLLPLFVFFLVIFAIPCVSAGEQSVAMTLEQAVARALHHNRQVRDSGLALDSSTLDLETAQSAFAVTVRPLSSINYTSAATESETVWRVGGEVAKKFTSGLELSLEPGIDRQAGESRAGVGFLLSVPLLRGLGKDVTMDQVHGREYLRDSARRNLLRQQVDTVLDTVGAVYGLIRDQQLTLLYEEQLELLQGHLHLARIKEKAGIGGGMDGYRAEIRIKEVEDSLNLAREQAGQAGDRLKEILVVPLDLELAVTAPMEYTLITMDVEEAVNIALRQRVEVEQGMADMEESRRQEKVARHNTLPELDLDLAYTRRGGTGFEEERLWPGEDVWSAGLSSATDLARTAEKNAWARSRLDVGRRELQLESTRQSIAREVRSVLQALDKSRERIGLRRLQIDQAKGKQQLALIKFEHNEADNFELIESQVQLQRAQVNLVSEEIAYIVNGYRLRAAMGTLLDNTEGGGS